MTKIEQAIALHELDALRATIAAVTPTPTGCSQCKHYSAPRCQLPDPSIEVPEHIAAVGCNQWAWDGTPF